MHPRIIKASKVLLIASLLLAGCNNEPVKPKIGNEPGNFKVAMVLPGKISDQSWNQAGYEGLNRVAKEVGAQTTFVEQIAQPDQAESLSDFGRQKFNVVIGHGGEFQAAALDVAKRYPDTLFLVNNGTEVAKNVGSIGFWQRQPGYVVGFIAARMSGRGKIGFIGGQKIKAYEELHSGFEAGAKAANPEIEVIVTWTNDWDDVAKGKEAANLQISQGADVIFPTMDNATKGSLQAAREKKIMAIGIYYDAIKDWPETVIQSAIIDIRGAMVETLKKVKEGDTMGREYRYGLDTPVAVRLGTYAPTVPQSVQDEVKGLLDQIQKGKLRP